MESNFSVAKEGKGREGDFPWRREVRGVSEGKRCAQENIRARVLEGYVSMDNGRKMTITMFLPLDFRVSIGQSTARNECGPGKDHRRRHLIDQVSVCFYF